MSHFRKAPVAFHLGMDDLVPLRVRQKSKVEKIRLLIFCRWSAYLRRPVLVPLRVRQKSKVTHAYNVSFSLIWNGSFISADLY